MLSHRHSHAKCVVEISYRITSMRTLPVPPMPMARAAPLLRSIARPFTNGPRSSHAACNLLHEGTAAYEVRHLGKAVSHGCVRISPQNATTLYTLVEKTGLKNTQVVLAGDTPGGEAKVANSESSRTHHSQSAVASRTRHNHVASRSFKPRSYYYADSSGPPPRRGGFFRRLFGGQ